MGYYIVSGAGSGIGRAIARKISGNGHNLILIGRNLNKLEETIALLNKGNHLCFAADVADSTSLKMVINKLEGIELNGIIANAGVGGENYWGADDRWNEIVNTNLTGTYNFVNTFLPNLKTGIEAKHIIITSSVLARLGVANYSAYCASKAGLLGLMRSWAVQYAPTNILVNAICPGWVDTDMANQGLQGIADNIGITKQEFYDIAMKSVPLARMSKPEEIADLVVYLLNQSSITGQAIDINCGSIMNS
jgi:NAD(P)-dependent dehydrogenase (short-subunit alcohol dehydrogenase family)